MSFYRPRLLAPGPVETAKAVADALAAPQLHHRTPEARAIVLAARAGLQQIFGLPEGWQTLVLSASGTGAFEAMLASLVPAGAPVLSLAAGKFGERWGQMAAALGYAVTHQSFPWGEAIAAEAVAALVAANPAAQALLFTHSETSTGTLHDLEAIAKAVRAVRPDLLILVDAITSLGVSELCPAEWGLDAVISGSQKGVAGPPGLGFVALSPRALAILETSKPHAYYFDLRRELKPQSAGETAYTPAINLIAALNAGMKPILAQIEREGLQGLWAMKLRHNQALLAAALALGCTSYSQRPSPACVTLVPPAPVTGRQLVQALLARGARSQGGQDAVKDTICRISFMGYFDRYDVLGTAGLLEDALADLGVGFERGIGVAAAWQRLGS
jgi:aspartate aminotransferase-like enzyme